MFESLVSQLLLVLHLTAITIIVARTSGMKLERELPSPDDSGRSRRKSNDQDDEPGLTAISKQLFQDIFTEHGNDGRLQFGYVCENPDQWEQRFEEKDLRNNRHRGKVKWGNVDGGYGEHYWDINSK